MSNEAQPPVELQPCPRTRRKERSPPKWSRDKDGRLKREFNFSKTSQQKFRQAKLNMSKRDKEEHFVSLCAQIPVRACRLSRKKMKYRQRMAHRRSEGDNYLNEMRFDDEDLLERELSYGRSGFALQFMLDTSLSDTDRYPLKFSDLMVMSVDGDKAPEKLVYGVMKEVKDIPNVGLAGDKYYAPEAVVGDYVDYTGSVLVIDPAGRGKDETAYAVVKMLNGFLYVPACGGLEGGYNDATLTKLATIAKEHKVNMVLIESNFGDGMFNELIKPYLRKIYPVTMEEVRHNIQKEKRIIDTLEPVMNQHRLIIDPKVIQKDFDSVQHRPPEQASRYMLTYQMSRITKYRGSLSHDDRLDALAMGVAYWVEQMAADVDREILDRKEQLLMDELDKFVNGYNINSKPRQASWI